MQIVIHLLQISSFGDQEEFEITRKTAGSRWRVTFASNTMFGAIHGSEEITALYPPDWLASTIEHLGILELKASSELEIPPPEEDNVDTYKITIYRDKDEKVIYYFNYDEHVSKYSDVWRADAFWKLLEYPILLAGDLDMEEDDFEL